MTVNGHETCFGGYENTLKLDCGDDCTSLWNTKKKHFKLVGFKICEINLNKVV